MINLFDYKDYRDFLQALIKNREVKGLTQVELAKAMSCQAAYLSQVLKSKAELTEDHAIKLCLFLKCNEIETEYFLVLLRLARAGTTTLQNYLETFRQKLISDHQEVGRRISSQVNKTSSEQTVYYCSSWIPAVIHCATSCETLQTPAAIAQRFEIEKSVVEFHLQALEKYGFVHFEKGKWIFQGQSIHFPKNSALDQSFQINRRLHAMNSLSKRKNEHIHYSTVFAIDAKTAQKIRTLLIDTIDQIHKDCGPAASEDVHSICLDFF